MKRPARLSDSEWADFQQCQAEENDLAAQVAAREAQIENDQISSYDEYEFDFTPQPKPTATDGTKNTNAPRMPRARNGVTTTPPGTPPPTAVWNPPPRPAR